MATSTGQTRDIIHALAMRELKTRFGESRLGLAWAILEPALHLAVWVGLLALLARSSHNGAGSYGLLVSGLVAWFFFINGTTKSISACDGNRALFMYRRVRPADTILARLLVEACVGGVTALVFLAAWGIWRAELELPRAPLELMGGCLLLATLTTGAGFACAALVVLWPPMRIVTGVMFRPLYFISAVFYPIAALSPQLRSYAALNPLAQTIEIIRYGWYGADYRLQGAPYGVAAIWAVGLLCIGLACYRRARTRMTLP